MVILDILKSYGLPFIVPVLYLQAFIKPFKFLAKASCQQIRTKGELKILSLGNSGIGKSTLIKR